MFTRCPACQATYELQVQELAEAAGVVRCSNCGKTFNSLACLFAQRPEEDHEPLRGGGMPPLLGHRIFLQHEIPGLDDVRSPIHEELLQPPDEAAAHDHESPPMAGARKPGTAAWTAAAGLLVATLAAQAVWLFDLPDRLLNAAPLDNVPPQNAIALIARDLHAHPSLADAIIISATLRNQAGAAIDLPILELRLYDSSNQVLGARRFRPQDYLPLARRHESRLAAGSELPIILEVMVTGSQPAGFEFRYFQDS